MKKTLLYPLAWTAAAVVLLASAPKDEPEAQGTASNGAPASSTGAPGEQNCTMSGCHVSFAANSGPGSLSMSAGSGLTSYEPGKTYSISVTVQQDGIDRFGFEWLALRDADNTNAGDITVSEPYRNWVVPGFGALADRRYVTYTYEGSLAPQPGALSWSFDWTAPQADAGDITFYLAGVAANHDGTDLGDYVYTQSIKLTSPSSSGIAENGSLKNLQVFPNPTGGAFNLSFTSGETPDLAVDLISVDGRLAAILYRGSYAGGRRSLPLNAGDVAEGLYLLRIRDGSKEAYARIAIVR